MNLKSKLFENFISLSFLQVATYILPLISLPYLVRVLGPDKFGLVIFAQSFVQYFAMFIDYGFNFSATREVSVNKDNKHATNEIFSTVLFVKFLFLLISFLVSVCLIFSFSKFRQDWFLYFISFSNLLGNVLFPQWFFQGMERMKTIAILNVVSKIIVIILIFIFVKTQGDYIIVVFLQSIGKIFFSSIDYSFF